MAPDEKEKPKQFRVNLPVELQVKLDEYVKTEEGQVFSNDKTHSTLVGHIVREFLKNYYRSKK